MTAPAPSGSGPRLLDRLLIVVLGLIPLALVRPTLQPMADPDTFWHILGGRDVLTSGTFVGPDPLPTLADRLWIKHQWLGEVVLAITDRAGGLAAVQAWTSIASLLIFVAVYWSARRAADPLPSALVAALAWGAASASIGPRPQVVSFILLAVSLRVWAGAVESGRPPWWLVLLSWLWASLHGLWFLGPLVGVVMIVGTAWTSRADPSRLRALARLALVPVLCVVAAGLTPLGWRVYAAPFQVSEVTQWISEWARPTFSETAPLIGLLLFVLTIATWLVPTARPTLTELLLTALAAYLLFSHARTVGLGGIILAPMLASRIQRIALQHSPSRITRAEWAALALGCVAALTIAGLVLPRAVDRPDRMPQALVPALTALPPGTVVFDDSMVGGWLLFTQPQLVVAIDTRVEIYDPAYVARYARALGGIQPRRLAEDINAGAALLPTGSPAVQQLTAAGWALDGTDQGFVLLVRPTP